MPWLRVTLRADTGNEDRIEALMEKLGAVAVTINADDSEAPLFDEPGTVRRHWQHPWISGLFAARAGAGNLLDRLTRELGGQLPEHRVETVPDQDWERAWMERYRPLQVSKQLWICPSWCKPVQPDATNLILDPGLAFGSGTHPTTLLCLRWLADRDLRGLTVLDYGCGSGILAIGALLLGARHAFAVDLDPQALAATRFNAKTNGVADRIDVCRPDQLDSHITTDIVVANILSETLIRLRDELVERLRPGGSLVLSGILDSQGQTVQDAYQNRLGLQSGALDGWLCLHGTRPGR